MTYITEQILTSILVEIAPTDIQQIFLTRSRASVIESTKSENSRSHIHISETSILENKQTNQNNFLKNSKGFELMMTRLEGAGMLNITEKRRSFTTETKKIIDHT